MDDSDSCDTHFAKGMRRLTCVSVAVSLGVAITGKTQIVIMVGDRGMVC